MDDFSTRLQELLDYLNLKPVTLAEEMGVQRTSFNHLLSGRNKPGFEFLNKLHSCYPFINLNWLISGTGSITENHDSNISSVEKKQPQTPVENDLFSNIFINPPLTSKEEDPPIYSAKTSEFKQVKPSTNTIEPISDVEIERLIIIYKSGKIVEVKN